jgi:superfamily II DNA/RNA helicase
MTSPATEILLEPTSFAELGLSAKVLEAATAAGYTTPTPIQAQAIPVALTGRDVLGIAQTGTGKTASFTLPMICRLETGRARARMPRSLILAPTRELAAQVAQSFETHGVNHKLDVALLIGGVSMDEQTRKLERGVDVLIATPGRLLDHFQRGRILLMGVEILVIDEADRMLDMGFIPDIEKVCKLLPPARQTLFFSATMPPEITRLVHTFMREPVRIEVAPPATTAKTITQRFVYVPTGEDWDKREILRTLLRQHGVRNAIIFCNRKVDVAILHKSLVKHGFNAGALHGDMEQRHRMETLDRFRSGEITFLVASDVAARGLDIPDVSHVFNFDLPRDKDDYVHRIGRTGRAGKEGNATSIVVPMDLKQVLEVQKMVKADTVWIGDAPTEQDFAEAGKRKRGRGGKPEPRPADRPTARPQHANGNGAHAAGGRHGGDRPSSAHGRLDAGARRLSPESRAEPRLDGPERVRSARPPMDRDPGDQGGFHRRRDGQRPRPAPRPEGRQQPQPAAAAPDHRRDDARPTSAADIRPAPPSATGDRPAAVPSAVATPGGQTRHAGTKPSDTRPSGTRPSETRPAETRPVQTGPAPDRRPRAAVRDSGRVANGTPRPEVAARARAHGRGADARPAIEGPAGGFADNVPAFLRRAPRPVKPAEQK